MVIGPIDHGELDRRIAQPLRRPQSAEAATYNYDARRADDDPPVQCYAK
jgi:hypothetical protein